MSRPHGRSIKIANGIRLNLDDLGSSPTGGGRGFQGKIRRRRRRRRFGRQTLGSPTPPQACGIAAQLLA